MPDPFTATVGVLGLTGGLVAWLNYRKAVLWKRAELANNYLKDFNNNPELVLRDVVWTGTGQNLFYLITFELTCPMANSLSNTTDASLPLPYDQT
jgi:hypothetical protein